MDKRTIFSVRPFQRSSPMALYCLLEVAIGWQSSSSSTPYTFLFWWSVIPRITLVSCHTTHRQKSKKDVSPGITSPSRDRAPPFLPLFSHPSETQEIARRSIMAMRRPKNTRTSMRHAPCNASYQLFSKQKIAESAALASSRSRRT